MDAVTRLKASVLAADNNLRRECEPIANLYNALYQAVLRIMEGIESRKLSSMKLVNAAITGLYNSCYKEMESKFVSKKNRIKIDAALLQLAENIRKYAKAYFPN